MKHITDKRLVEEAGAFIEIFMRDRFPEGLPTELEPIVREIVFDSYLEGVMYGQELAVSRIILAPNNKSDKILRMGR